MATARTTTLVAGAAVLAATVLLSLFGQARPSAAGPEECTDVSLSPTPNTARRGGHVLLRGRACREVKLKIRKKRRWVKIARADSDGEFAVCVPVNPPRGSKVARFQAVSAGGRARTTVRISKKGASRCALDSRGCSLSQPGSTIGMTSACTLVMSDTASNPDPVPPWGSIDCVTDSRHQQITSGGDAHLTATGASQGDSAYRRMTVIDGDDFYGERCELGRNDISVGPTVLYYEGQRRVTYISLRLPSNFPLSSGNWQVVMQMKQTQPSNNGSGTPALGLYASAGRWRLGNSGSAGPSSNTNSLWTTPAQKNVWTRFAFDVTYSVDPSTGSVKLYVDLTGDGDFSDPGEQGPRFRTHTLKHETGSDSSDGLSAGQSIPSHLRAGPYHDPAYSCPSGCSVDVDNVQVVRP